MSKTITFRFKLGDKVFYLGVNGMYRGEVIETFYDESTGIKEYMILRSGKVKTKFLETSLYITDEELIEKTNYKDKDDEQDDNI